MSIDWILTGKERKIAVVQNREGSSKRTEARDRKEFFKEIIRLQEWLLELTAIEPERRAWFKMELLDKFPAFKEWLGIIEAAKKEQQKAA